ncbi:hypothetical protein FQA39_LY05995 [Lamprigera yunnana]|nr:hypothetical protein FQA39_LY05995 [Lamprigera yunnana]
MTQVEEFETIMYTYSDNIEYLINKDQDELEGDEENEDAVDVGSEIVSNKDALSASCTLFHAPAGGIVSGHFPTCIYLCDVLGGDMQTHYVTSLLHSSAASAFVVTVILYLSTKKKFVEQTFHRRSQYGIHFMKLMAMEPSRTSLAACRRFRISSTNGRT